ncbi:50S ribosomal protein L25 [Candidatus Parcubacteria bacterium]|nr:50S ribosomal protein L25 [Patescibacteria group bacterium]MBU4466523.1 50S ribosomal protein L25 [Patescibacteria group bacterium]MCG2688322.1 50S ribosomal protein L25 [Candidatus Parcubacteria bacterium]
MLTLKAKTRSVYGRKTESLRNEGKLPAVLYGPGLKENLDLEIDTKEFIKVFQETGRTSFLQLEVEDSNFLVLVNNIQKDPLTLSLSHIDFYQPAATKEIKVRVPLVFIGEAGAVKNLGGTLVKNIQEIQVQALPQNLPHEIKVNLAILNELEKSILVQDLEIPPLVKILKNPEEIIVQVMASEEIEEELAKPVEEKIDQVGVVEKEKKEKEPEEIKE